MTARLAAVCAAAAALAFGAPARAATLTTDKPCYVEGTAVAMAGGGFTPGGQVNVLRDNVFQGPLTADATGAIAGRLAAPSIAPTRQRPFSLTAIDAANSANQATVNALVTQLDVVVKPKGGNPARKRKITARGFPRGKNLWVHVVRKRKKRSKKIGKLKGPCGKLKKKKRIFSRRAKTGTYTVQFDVKKRYRKKTVPRVTFRVFIFRRLRVSSAGAAGVGERWVRVD